MFKPTQNIDTAFRAMRLLTMVIVIASLFVNVYAIRESNRLAARMQERVYVLASGKAMEALAGNRKENLEVEARDHVAMFHTWFFSLDPDEKVIQTNIKRALYLADASAKHQYDDLVETGYIAGIISGNVSQQITVDSITLNTIAEPYVFKCFSTLKIIRPTSIATRNLITQGSLRGVSRSDHNPHGFLIERWETIENKDLKIENR